MLIELLLFIWYWTQLGIEEKYPLSKSLQDGGEVCVQKVALACAMQN